MKINCKFFNSKLLLFSLCIFILSCKTTQNVTINKQKQGLWIQKDSTGIFVLKSVGKYKNNQEIGTWKYYQDNKLFLKEKYKNSICKTKQYHQNRNLEKKGYTKLEITNKLSHWYYFGTWKFFDQNRKFIEKVEYIKGKRKDSLSQNFTEGKMNFSAK